MLHSCVSCVRALLKRNDTFDCAEKHLSSISMASTHWKDIDLRGSSVDADFSFEGGSTEVLLLWAKRDPNFGPVSLCRLAALVAPRPFHSLHSL